MSSASVVSVSSSSCSVIALGRLQVYNGIDFKPVSKINIPSGVMLSVIDTSRIKYTHYDFEEDRKRFNGRHIVWAVGKHSINLFESKIFSVVRFFADVESLNKAGLTLLLLDLSLHASLETKSRSLEELLQEKEAFQAQHAMQQQAPLSLVDELVQTELKRVDGRNRTVIGNVISNAACRIFVEIDKNVFNSIMPDRSVIEFLCEANGLVPCKSRAEAHIKLLIIKSASFSIKQQTLYSSGAFFYMFYDSNIDFQMPKGVTVEYDLFTSHLKIKETPMWARSVVECGIRNAKLSYDASRVSHSRVFQKTEATVNIEIDQLIGEISDLVMKLGSDSQ